MRRLLPLLALLVPLTGVVARVTVGAAPGLDLHRLPLGDHRTSTAPKRGYVFACNPRFDPSGPGAGVDGPWIDTAKGTWDATAKATVQGAVRRTVRHAVRTSGSRVRVSGDGLPALSGVFPISPSDPAYAYDRNPNAIRSYALLASLPRNPRRARSASCAGGTVGIMRNGIPLFSAFDATGRDAAAHEVQDRCSGHPQNRGQYHYHALSACLEPTPPRGRHSALLGYALDGFGIYGLHGEKGETMTTAKLDACHGHTHVITWHGKRVRMYHYHATRDFPYVIGCFRGTPITTATGLDIGRPR